MKENQQILLYTNYLIIVVYRSFFRKQCDLLLVIRPKFWLKEPNVWPKRCLFPFGFYDKWSRDETSLNENSNYIPAKLFTKILLWFWRCGFKNMWTLQSHIGWQAITIAQNELFELRAAKSSYLSICAQLWTRLFNYIVFTVI